MERSGTSNVASRRVVSSMVTMASPLDKRSPRLISLSPKRPEIGALIVRSSNATWASPTLASAKRNATRASERLTSVTTELPLLRSPS